MTTRYITTCDQCKKEITEPMYGFILLGSITPLEIQQWTVYKKGSCREFCSFTCLTEWVLSGSHGKGKG